MALKSQHKGAANYNTNKVKSEIKSDIDVLKIRQQPESNLGRRKLLYFTTKLKFSWVLRVYYFKALSRDNFVNMLLNLHYTWPDIVAPYPALLIYWSKERSRNRKPKIHSKLKHEPYFMNKRALQKEHDFVHLYQNSSTKDYNLCVLKNLEKKSTKETEIKTYIFWVFSLCTAMSHFARLLKFSW